MRAIKKFFSSTCFRIISFVFLVSSIISLFLLVNSLLFTDSLLFSMALILIIIGLNFVVYIVKKPGTATLFLFFVGVETFFINDIGVLGWKKIVVFVLASLLFELIFLILNLQASKFKLEVVFASTLAITNLPLITALFLSPRLASTFPPALINLILIAFFVVVNWWRVWT